MFDKFARRSLALEVLESRLPFAADTVDLLGAAQGNAKGKIKLPYSYAVTGNAVDVSIQLPAQSGGLALVGGGTDIDEVFRWMGAKANGGDFLVLRASGTNAYNSYIDRLVPSLDSVATLIVPDGIAAAHSDVASIIRNAEAIFIAGGDQSNYIQFWNDTPLETALYDAVRRNVPIGGSSAGLAVLGEVDFSGAAGTISSSESLANPLDPRIVQGLDATFLNPEEYALSNNANSVLRYMDNVITESHFMQRDRMGRLLTLMAVSDAQDLVPQIPRAIGVNEQTALLIEPDGLSRVVGNPYDSKKLTQTQQQRSVYLLQGATPSPIVAANIPLQYEAHVLRATYDPLTQVGDTFDLDTLYASAQWDLVGFDRYDVQAAGGSVVTIDPSDLIYGEIGIRRRLRLA